MVGIFCSLRHKLNNSNIMKILEFFGDLGYRGYQCDQVYSKFGTIRCFISDVKIVGDHFTSQSKIIRKTCMNIFAKWRHKTWLNSLEWKLFAICYLCCKINSSSSFASLEIINVSREWIRKCFKIIPFFAMVNVISILHRIYVSENFLSQI